VRTAFAGLLLAVTAAAQPAFEVASVKPNTSGDRSSFSRAGKNSLFLQNWTLRRIILKAYDLKDYALTGPDWLASLSFDINARTDGPVTEAALRQMLQTLLAERFRLKAHTAMRNRQAYVLVADKGGLKPKPLADGSSASDDCDLSRLPEKTRISCRHCSMDYLAGVLSGQLDGIVVDRSASQATYAFALEWSPDSNTGAVGPSIFTALKEELGLRLERRRVIVPILIVDGIAKTPTEN
jgi:uncharacterized protein (TIGR03435 family)